VCGLCGVFARDGLTPADLRSVRAATELLARRGPDDDGYWCEGRVVLGFRRLAILDTSERGHQPMLTRDGRYVIVFNGELYNFRELRSQLERECGVGFRSTSDTEVALCALACWGVGALDRFNGMFALAFHDLEDQSIVLARDPLGIKPLYLLSVPQGVVFGSQYDVVVRHPWCNRARLCPDVLGLYLRLSYVPAPFGLVADTYQVPAGEYALVRGGRLIQFRRYTSVGEPAIGADVDVDVDPDAKADLLGATLEAAVGRQKVSDVALGSFLSGGVDSPLVTALLRRSIGPGAGAFTIGTDDPAFDESAAAGRYAEAIGCTHHVGRIGGARALSLLDDVVSAFSEPFADYSAFPSLDLAGLARRHVTVALSGDGGDELFWGYPRSWKVMRARRWFHTPRPVRTLAYGSARLARRRWPPAGVRQRSIGDWYLDSHSALKADALVALNPEIVALPEDFTEYIRAGVGSAPAVAEWMRRLELRGHLEMVLTKVDRTSMFHSLEVRVPLLDLDVVGAALRLPYAACVQDGVGKIPLRRSLEALVPPALIGDHKRGFSVPMGEWLKHDLRDVFGDHLLSASSAASSVLSLDRRAIETLYRSHCSGERDITRGLWNLLALALWEQRHLQPLAAGPRPLSAGIVQASLDNRSASR
jgi:asparagine synthase (glutamine-hydrolysing)